MNSLKNNHFLKLLDLTPVEITYLLDLAADLKAKKKAGIPHRLCVGKSIALIFRGGRARHGGGRARREKAAQCHR